MLQLKNIVKTYAMESNSVCALRGISLEFRKNEFVSILGPSGCGKTTMLNLIGGLDQYSSGDLIIDGVSTKNYKDRDWDAYRNHRIGFVFQNYHLIPHQSVLQNVELALTLSGVSKGERRRRATQALEQVGLGDQLKKRPGEMSGGQMQRVAIARALVNNPQIILADEPTGALDTKTSVQVMEILKEISKDRLVIMVTHNPDLAEKYSTRIVRMLDGEITHDSAPLTPEERETPTQEKLKKEKKQKQPSMSFATSFGLSLKNLFTKKGRTLLTSFAGSIGIIGIALIFAVSQGMTTYINTVQEETLSSYPLTLEATTVDLGTLMQTFMGVGSDNGEEHDLNAVYSQSVMLDMINALNNMESTRNDLKSFKSYLENRAKEAGSPLEDALTGISYTYPMDLLVYTKDVDGRIIHSDTEKLLSRAIAENMGMDMSAMMSMRENMTSSFGSAMMPGQTNLWCELLPGKDGKAVNPVLDKQYEVIYGNWPNRYDEVVLVVDENNELDDMTLYAMGLVPEEQVKDVFSAVQDGGKVNNEQRHWTFEEICDMDFRVIFSGQCYGYDEESGLYTDLRETENGLRYLYDNGLKLRVTGIIRPREEAVSTMLKGAIGYTRSLTEYVVEKGNQSPALLAQKENPETDIFTGLPFKDNENLTDADKETAFKAYVEKLDTAGKAQTYVKILSTPTPEQLNAAVEQAMGNVTREQMEKNLIEALSRQAGMNQQQIEEYVTAMSDEDLESMMRQGVEEQVRKQMAQKVLSQTAGLMPQQLAATLDMAMQSYTTQQFALYYGEVLSFSESTYEENLRVLNDVDLDNPATMNLYASSFENKEVLEEIIRDYNEDVPELQQIHYTDYVGIMMASITTIIDAITYVLISFVAISLVVSSIMIGVITLISVQERTKEIGILRAIGASKRNVSSLFNAETMIIGFTSGLLGVGVTYLLCLPINAIIQSLTGIANLRAYLPVGVAFVLILISVLLTLISGIIPSSSAARKDPVVALRTE